MTFSDYDLKHILNRALAKVPFVDKFGNLLDKSRLETYFWQQELKNYIKWFNGDIAELYGISAPTEDQKVTVPQEKDSAILTWHKIFQEQKYMHDLNLSPNVFNGLKVLDIGSGPFPSATIFGAAELYCLDPLWGKYLSAGYSTYYYENLKVVNAFSEEIPLPSNYFDVIISVNALDHVNDFARTAAEIRRTLKPGGKLAFHCHMHPKTLTEPIQLTESGVLDAFSWSTGFVKVNESHEKFGWKLTNPGEIFALFKNF